jgi:hypothetical protein|tara:strand:+ start:75 stop:332 length:258 start_codon:yes stop_codon:yes gene_type:complete
MAVEVDISKDNADYYVEAYTVYCVNHEPRKVRLAYVAGYRDYDLGDEEQIATWLDLKNKLKEAYESYPDGEVTVKLVIKDDWVNV